MPQIRLFTLPIWLSDKDGSAQWETRKDVAICLFSHSGAAGGA